MQQRKEEKLAQRRLEEAKLDE
jgi:hypothetical protein